MKKTASKSIQASVKQRLLNLARQTNQEFNLLLIRYGIERFLYRLAQSDQRDAFVLKGAILFQLFAAAPHRPTKDVDLLGRGAPDIPRMQKIMQRICGHEVADDGIEFDANSVVVARIKEADEYSGLRVNINGRLGTAHLRLQIDIGFGDAITPRPTLKSLPCLLDLPVPRMRVYAWETVVAEKFQALVELGMTNSRMKDFFDLAYLAVEFEFDGARLAKAIESTFKRRQTELPAARPAGLSTEFTEDPATVAKWQAFLRRSRLDASKSTLTENANAIWLYLEPVVEALKNNGPFKKYWQPGTGWQ